MRSSIYCFVFILLLVKKVKPKVFTDPESEENGRINLNQLLQLFKKPRSNEFKEVTLDISENADSMVRNTETAKTQKLQRLAEFNKEQRSFESQPYTEFYELYTQRPKRTIYSLHNYYGRFLKAKPLFKDPTCQEFSQDYLDISDLSRSQPECTNPGCKNQKHLLTCFPNTQINDNKRRVLDVMQRSRSDSSDTSDSEADSDRKPNRFQVVFTEDASLESDDIKQSSDEQKSSSQEYTTKKLTSKKRKPKMENSDSDSFEERPKSKEKYAFLQGNRVFNDFRRRLQHFLPKRFHWDEKDIDNLGYYCLWAKYTQAAYSALRVQYNNALRAMLGLPRYCSASGMFAAARVDCFHTVMRKRAASLVHRLRASANTVLAMIAGRVDCPYTRHCCHRHALKNPV